MSDDGGMRPVLLRLLEGRVGSTLVMQLLATAPDVAFDRVYPFENSYLTYFVRLTGQIAAPGPEEATMADLVYGDPTRVGPLPFDSLTLDPSALGRSALHALWQAFSQLTAGTGPAPLRLYAEKYWGDVGPVIAAGLDPVVVDLIRDPRDVVASVRAFNAKTGVLRFGRAAARDEDQHLRRIAAGMRFRLTEFAQTLGVEHLTIRYEDLVSDLAAQTACLGDALGVRLDAAAVGQAQPEMARHMTSASAASSVGRWRQDLAPDDVAAIERVLGRQMTVLGYELSSTDS